MNKADLANIKSDYELFNIILFNNSLPRANKIDFILHDLTIKQVCDDKLILDENIKPRLEYYVFFAESHGKHLFFKVKIKDFDKIVEKLNDDNYTKVFSNIYAIKTKSYLYNLLAFNKDIPEFAQESLNANTKEDLYDENNPENIWIIKNNEYIYSK